MGFDLSGFVLRPPRIAPGNKVTTGEVVNGVLRDVRDLPGSYDLPGELVEINADQYRASTLLHPDGTSTQEYLLFAANNSSITVVEDPSWAITADNPTDTVSIPTGSLDVDRVSPALTFTDGTDRLIVVDTGDRAISDVRLIQIVRGDTLAVITVGPDGTFPFDSQDPDAGVVRLNAAALAALDGGVSNRRGDTITEVSYVLAAARFWWTRNDSLVERFSFNGRAQRWEPLKGGAPAYLDLLAEGETYTLVPRPTRFSPGDFLPGNTLDPDSFAMIRVGSRPDSTATVVDVEVVTDQQIEDGYTFSGSTPDAVIGSTNGIMVFNPVFVTANAGRSIWYSYETFQEDSDGLVGALLGSDDDPLFLSPVPEINQRPFLRIGSRRHLTPLPVETDADLAVLSVGEGEVGWSRSTGRLKFSSLDIAKADPDDAGFDIQYLGSQIYFDGIAMSTRTIRTRDPVQLVDSGGSPVLVGPGVDLFIPDAAMLPSPGVSGVFLLPDKTGTIPTTTTPDVRPNGSGLVREVEGVGDLVIFGRAAALEEIEIVERDKDLPDFPFAIRRGKGWISKEEGSGGSKVAMGSKDRNRFNGEEVYFLQADVMPAVFADQAQMFSRELEPFALDGTEVLAFAIDGTTYTWTAPGAGDFDAATVAASLDAVVTGTGQVVAKNGRIVIEAGSLTTGSIEIGFGSTTSGALVDRDLSGCAALGFLPGWRIDDPSSNENWLPDNGTALGVFRSPLNLDRSGDAPDFVARDRFDGQLLTDSISATPFLLLDVPPLQDIAGFDENVFFQIIEGLNVTRLQNFENALYDFGNSRFIWIDQSTTTGQVEQATNILPLGFPGVIADSLDPNVITNGGLYVSATGGAFTLFEEGVDFILPAEGNPGTAVLTNLINGRLATGGAGTITAGGTTFLDPNATFLTDGVATGYRLVIEGGDAQGSYIVDSVTSETELEISADVPFPVSDTFVSWRIHEGFSPSVYDPGLVADVQYTQFNHLLEETFKVRLLSSVGVVPTSGSVYSTAVVTEALESGRVTSVRFGLDNGSPEATLTTLTRTELGILANNSLSVPDVSDPHFTAASPTFPSFYIQVGTQQYTLDGGDLIGVTAFSSSLPGDDIEYGLPGSPIEGQLQFGDTVLTNLEASTVIYYENFLDPSSLATGEAELNAGTGEINFSAADRSTHGGVTEAYFVEQMVTEQQQDVVTSPLAGTVYFNRPLRSGQIVEVSYYQAATDGSQLLDENGFATEITEFLPLFVRQEEATPNPLGDRFWDFNPTGRTIDDRIEIIMWAGPERQNYGLETTATFDTANSVAAFLAAPPPGATVRLNYAVLEAFGGEQSYSVSSLPVYRPPFFLEAGVSEFVLEGDRTGDMVPGKLLRLGATPIYIKSATFGGTDTTVEIFPTNDNEVGSRAPGNDLNSLLTDIPVTDEVDGVPTSAPAGFLLSLLADYEPVDKGMLSIIFKGNVTQFSKAGHLLEISGYPFLIAGSTLSDDGFTTKVEVTTPFPRGFTAGVDAVRISARPIYQPLPRSFLGLGPFVETEPTELVLFGETDSSGNLLPGRTLVPGIDYTVDTSTGDITFVEPRQAALQPGQSLYFSFTRVTSLAPFLTNGVLVAPRFRATFAHAITPSAENTLLGSVLTATYTFSSPDSFYYRAVPLRSYLGEVAQAVTARVAAQSPSGGSVVAVSSGQENYEAGSLGLDAQLRDRLDQDRGALTFVELYNAFIVAFEQILETVNAKAIGDRDGKFRLFVGKGKNYPPPGWQDSITGDINPRNVWKEVFFAANGFFTVTEDDPIVDPETATQNANLEVEGDNLDPFALRFYILEQQALVRNDMDDIVLTGRSRPRLSFGFPFPSLVVRGIYERMADPSILSRLFPELGLAFTTTFPGLLSDLASGDPGQYSFLKVIEPPKLFKGEGAVTGSTFRQPIGSVSNPAYGLFENIVDANVRERLPRARVWAYSPTGFPELDDLYGSTTADRPAVIATPLFLEEFPVDPDTGLPDISQLASNGGTLFDLGTGDQELSTPPWQGIDRSEKILPQVACGRPTGETFQIGLQSKTLGALFGGAINLSSNVYAGIFVEEIQLGCVILFSDDDRGTPNPIEDASDIIVIGSGDLEASPFSLERGDTIFVIPPGSGDTEGMSDPPTVEELEEFADNQPIFRRGFDIGVRDGEFRDLTLPSFKDPNPFGLKEISGQRPPRPMSTIEADIEFTNNSRDPFNFPALQGLPTNDDGDYAVPYLALGGVSELDRLGQAAQSSTSILQTDAPGALAAPGLAVYPDEVVGNDGSVTGAAVGTVPPAALISARDFTPVATAGSYTANSGIRDIESFDVLLVETPEPDIGAGSQGILQIGRADTNELEPARFVSPAPRGTPIGYIFANAFAHVSTSFSTGMVTAAGAVTTFDISSFGGLFLNDGAGVTTDGGLNDIIPFGSGNRITIHLYQNGGGGTPGALVETIVLTGTDASGGAAAGVPLPSGVSFTNNLITVPAAGFLSNVGGPFDFTISVDTTPSGSTTARIHEDRLTFSERFDFSSALERNSTNAGTTVIDAQLIVSTVTGSGLPITTNDPASVNGGSPFTFLRRDAAFGDIGFFTPATFSGAGDELSTIRVMGFEGANNTPILSTGNVTFSAIPSSPAAVGTILNPLGTICTGTGISPDGTERVGVENANVTAGDISNVEAGDLLVIRESATGDAAVKAGTYLVRHAVKEEGSIPGANEVFSSVQGGGSGWLDFRFPKVVSVSWGNGSNGSLIVDDIDTVDAAIRANGLVFPASGTVYILKSSSNLDQVLVATYSAVTLVGNGYEFTLTDGTATLGNGVAITNAAFASGTAVNNAVSGMDLVNIGTFKASFPSNNVVGFDSGGTTTGGFVNITAVNSSAAGGGSNTWVTGVDLVNSTSGAPSASQMGVFVSDAPGGTLTADSQSFLSDLNTPVFEDVPLVLDLTGITTAQWNTIHGTTGAAVAAPVASDAFQTHDGASTAGTAFQAAAGIFIEPSWARPVLDLDDGEEKVVNSTYTVSAADRIGMRDAAAFGIVAAEEDVAFEVRRIRRFHDVVDNLSASLQPLRFAYEIRRGTVGSYTAATRTFVASGTGTQLGGFDEIEVNINPGDTVRLLDADGNVVDEAVVGSVTNATTLILNQPGFSEVLPSPGDSFEVFINRPTVPHEQSNQQLFELITDSVVLDRTAVPATNDGGAVATTNIMTDVGVADFAAAGVQEGDILIVDPAGDLEGPTGPASPVETGSRPIGDQSVLGRPNYIAGSPSEFDDNRGFYRVVSAGATLEVTGAHTYAGDSGSSDVEFGASSPVDQRFVIYPTIHASGLTAGTEGQNDLRVTAPADGLNSYDSGGFFSIEPFSYRIIRPTSLVSEEAVDLVLMHRERILSWIEELSSTTSGGKEGSYYIFQRDDHIADLGSPTDPDDGLGVPSNLLLTTLSGLVDAAPFENTSDCLSVLDRRYFVLDLRLDTTVPPNSGGSVPYSSFESDALSASLTPGSGRPVLPDRVDDVLDRADRLRNLRFSWIKFRTERVNGTLPNARRFEADLPRLKEEQQDLLRLKAGLDEA